MERFAAFVRQEGVKALVVALPEQSMFANAGDRVRFTKDQDGVLACAAKAGLQTLDTFSTFAKVDTANGGYYTQSHFTDRGAALAVQAIAAALSANGE